MAAREGGVTRLARCIASLLSGAVATAWTSSASAISTARRTYSYAAPPPGASTAPYGRSAGGSVAATTSTVPGSKRASPGPVDRADGEWEAEQVDRPAHHRHVAHDDGAVRAVLAED